MNALELTGRTRTHVVETGSPGVLMHPAAAAAFLAMCEAAARAGIALEAVSAFRHFDRQRQLWNAKYRGERPVLDAAGRPVDVDQLGSARRVETILLWTALPGASRHHWGTDLDVIDRAAIGDGYAPRLVTDEYGPAGPFGRLTAWLDGNMRRFAFFRPYATGRGGVRPEPWHLSFAPVARKALAELEVDMLAEAIRGHDVLGEAAILARLGRIHGRYVRSIDAPPRMRSRWARRPGGAGA
jgi:LAS superfamily LD-carboxypeptidase LdcB